MERMNQASHRHTSRRNDAHGLLHDLRILVVEDETIIAMELQSTFEDEGAEVVGPAFTLKQGMELAIQQDFSAAVLDLRLGRDPVSPIARALAARNIPFLFYSGQPPDDPIRAEWPEAFIVAKPATGASLIRAVRHLVEQTDVPASRAMRG